MLDLFPISLEGALDMEIGRMLLDLEYEEGRSGRGQPRFFMPRLQKGVLRIEPESYRALGGVHAAN